MPIVYVTDTMGPALMRWYFNRDTFNALVLYFNEPVNANLPTLANNTMTITVATQSVVIPLQILTITYSSYQSEVSLQFNTSTFDFSSLLSNKASVIYLNITQNVFFDLAVPTNGNAAVVTFQEGSPGKIRHR